MRRQLLAFVAALGPGLAEARAPCPDLALVMAIDASGSVDEREYSMQRDGIAAAFRDEAVLAAIEAAGQVSVAAVFWADPRLPAARIEWVDVTDPADAERFAGLIATTPRTLTGSTGLGAGLSAALDMIEEGRPCARRKIVNVSGDGAETVSGRHEGIRMVRDAANPHAGTDVAMARARAAVMGVTVNALAILDAEKGLAAYYERLVITGPGAFVMTVADYHGFPQAIRLKLEREIQPVLARAGGPTLVLADATGR